MVLGLLLFQVTLAAADVTQNILINEELTRDMVKTHAEIRRELEESKKLRRELEVQLRAYQNILRVLQARVSKVAIPTANVWPTTSYQVDDKVVTLYSKAFDLYYQKNYLAAIAALKEAIQLSPNQSLLYSRLGSIYYELGMKEEAQKSWRQALKLEPNNQELIELLSQ